MKSIINELWHGNIIPQEDSRTNSKEMKELLGYMARHHENLGKSFTNEQKETFAPFPQEKAAMGIPMLWLINNDDITPPWGKIARIKV